MKIGRAVPRTSAVVFSMLCYAGAASLVQAEPLDLPKVKNETLSALLEQANAEYQRYAVHADDYFKFDPAKQWPCKVSDEQLRDWTGTIDSADQAYNKSKTAAAPAAKVSEYGYSFANTAFHPVVAACKNGKPDGNIELVYERDRKAWGPTYQGASRQQGKVTLHVVDGKAQHTIDLRTAVDAPAANDAANKKKPAMAAKSPSITASAEHLGKSGVSAATILKIDAAKPMMYFFKRPVAGNRIERTVYTGATLTAIEMQDKAGRADGPTLTYKDGQAQKKCFKHGQPLATKNCS
ncbi:hypothetical protein [Eoetvoesiella caeni]